MRRQWSKLPTFFVKPTFMTSITLFGLNYKLILTSNSMTVIQLCPSLKLWTPGENLCCEYFSDIQEPHSFSFNAIFFSRNLETNKQTQTKHLKHVSNNRQPILSCLKTSLQEAVGYYFLKSPEVQVVSLYIQSALQLLRVYWLFKPGWMFNNNNNNNNNNNIQDFYSANTGVRSAVQLYE